jgi:hypothetical protein
MIEISTLIGTAFIGFVIGVYLSYIFFLKALEVYTIKGVHLDDLMDIPSRLREDDSETPKYLKEEYTHHV